MSLHTLAQHLQSAGRGEDKVLVHMTPNEVSGLQSLAMAHGGSLTINPETGLPEAGFLSSILPMVAGAALTATGVGAPMAALMVGAAGTVATGSLQKGLMMGLGAYGGAGIGAGLMGAGAGAGAAGATAEAIAAQNAARTAASTAGGIGQSFSNMAVAPSAATAGTVGGMPAALNAAVTGTGQAAVPTATSAPVATPPVVTPTAVTPVTQGAPGVESNIMSKLKTMGGNVSKLFGSSEEDKQFRDQFLKENKMPLIAGGISALSLSREEPKMPQEQGGYTTFNPTYNRIAQSGGNYQAGAYPSATGERRYFADGGLADLPVARMSQQNMTGSNQMYPMSQIKPYGYAVPRNNPVSQDVIKPMDYQSVDPYTGEQKFADGGLASLVSMATGGFVSKLKAVSKPAEIKPKLQSTAAIDKKIAGLEKYSNLDEVQGRYNDLQNQIKEIQQQKKDRATESANAAKDYNAAIAQINKDKANRLKEVNADFSNRIREIQADKGRPAKEKQAAIAEIQREQKSAVAGVNTEFADAIKNRQSEYNNFKKDYSASVKDFDTRIAALNKEATPAKNAAAMAKQYQDAVAQRDKLIAANEAATNKAREQNEAAMAKYTSYQDALAAERQAWQEETGRKATGIQAIRPQTITKSLAGSDQVKTKIAELEKQKELLPRGGMGAPSAQAAEIQKQIDELKAGTSAEGYTPAYIKDPKTGKLIPSSEAPPITEFKPFTKVPGYDTTKRLMEEKDIMAVFEDVAGRRPTAAEMDRFLGTQSTDAAIAQFAMNQPDVKANVQYTDDDFRENFRYYIGRDPSSGELASMKKAKITNFNQMRNFLQQQPAYLKNLNAVAQQAFTQQQKTAEEALAEQARLSASLTPEQVSTAYRDVLGRMPSMDEIKQYMGAQQTPQGLEGILRGSEEYMGKLTQPFIPTPTPRYAPGTVLEYTPQQAAAGLGGITTGVQPTPSGLQAPLTRGAVTLEGAMPLNPTFQEQLGLQTLATQAAEKAPALQTGMQFAAPQPQNVFGFQPYAQPAQPQSLEALMAALRAQQQQGVSQFAEGGMAGGGYNLGDYSDGGRLLKGPGDGVSDSIPASIGGRQPARLADGEFVIPARIVSELGNGSTDAGARKLYAMMDRIQRARRKSVGKDRVAVDSKAEKLLPV